MALVTRSGNSRHAVTVTGAERGVDESGQCTTALKALQVMTPSPTVSLGSRPRPSPTSSLPSSSWSSSTNTSAALDEWGFPVDAAVQVDRRFRAQAG